MSSQKLDPPKKDFIKFLGTAGARFVMIKQLRASGGIWVNSDGTDVLIDPGPGSIVRCNSSRPRLDPSKLEGIILTHRHLDHCGDINVMIEAMTEGGFKKRGEVFCPQDALKVDPVILKYARKFPRKISVLKPLKDYQCAGFGFRTSLPHDHPVETYGLRFKIKDTTVAVMTDTRYFKGLNRFYKSDVLIISVVFFEPHPAIAHLSLPDAQVLIGELKSRKTILTHFGMSMLKASPHVLAEQLSQKTGREVVAAYDGMSIQF